MTNYRRMVLFIIFALYTVVFGVRISIGVTLPALIQEFGITKTEAGALSGFFFLGYFLTQVPAGFWIARFGSRTLVSLALCFAAIFLWLFGTMTSLAWAGWYRFGLGISQGPVSVGGNAIISQWFPPREQSRAISIMVASTMLAPVLFPPLSAWVIVEWGWRFLFQAFAAAGLCAAALWQIFIRSSPEESKRCSPAELAAIRNREVPAAVTERLTVPRSLNRLLHFARTIPVANEKRTLLRSPDLWRTTVAYFCFVSVFYGVVTWLPLYFMQERGVTTIEMGWLSAIPWVGAFAGSLVGGWIVDRLLGGNPLPVMIGGSIFTALSLAVFAWLPVGFAAMLLLLLQFGFFVGVTPAGFMTYPIRLASRKIYPVGMSIMNSGGNIGGFVSPLLAGMLLDAFQGFFAVFVYLVACSLLSALLSAGIRRPVDRG